MPRPAGRILKANDIKLEGQFRLNVGQPGQNTQRDKSAVLSTSQVRIAENHPEFAVIEVTCCCGSKTLLRCDYAAAQAAQGN